MLRPRKGIALESHPSHAEGNTVLNGLMPLCVSFLGGLPAPTNEPLTLPLRIPKAQVRAALEGELETRDLLDNFQVVTSKFSDGRIVLQSFKIGAGPRAGTASLEAHADLSFARRQLGVKWRGLKSRKKWFQKGRKNVARVRVTCVVGLAAGAKDRSVHASLTSIRVKLISNLTPARGLTARFDMEDRTFDWSPGEGSLLERSPLRGLRLSRLAIDEVTDTAIHLGVDLRLDAAE